MLRSNIAADKVTLANTIDAIKNVRFVVIPDLQEQLAALQQNGGSDDEISAVNDNIQAQLAEIRRLQGDRELLRGFIQAHREDIRQLRLQIQQN